VGALMAIGLPSNKQFLVLFSRSKSHFALFSKAIMLLEKRKFSHAAVELAEPVTRAPLIFQASHSLVNFFYKPTFLQHNEVAEAWLIETAPIEYLSIWSYAVHKMGSDYGWLEIASIFASKLFRIKSWFKDGDKTNICSELAARVLRRAGLPMPESLDSLTPSDLQKLLLSCENGITIRRVKYEEMV
jgi:hypothetical protein